MTLVEVEVDVPREPKPMRVVPLGPEPARLTAETDDTPPVSKALPGSELSLGRQLTLANLVTTASLVVGFVALLEATRTGLRLPDGRLRLVLLLIVAAAVFDAVDGPIARLLSTTGLFGGTLDSLADVVSFGVAPAAAAYFSSLHRLPVAGVAVSVAFCVCAAWRLARFQLCGHSEWFVGCPVPLAAVLLGLIVAVDRSTGGALLATSLISGLMVGTIPFPTWGVLLAKKRRGDGVEAVEAFDEPVETLL